MKHWLLLVPLAALLAACRSTSGTDADAGIRFRTLARGYQSGIATCGTRIARTPSEWLLLWKDHTSTVIPRPEPPAVDWSSEMVICVTLGARPSGGFGVEVERLDAVGAVLRVIASERKPAPDAIEPAIVTQPYHLIATARRDGAVECVCR